MPGRWRQLLILIPLGSVLGFAGGATHAEDRIALKNGESVEIGSAYFVSHCKSVLLEPPQVEVLDGPPQLVLTIREEMVIPRRYSCPEKVAGGILSVAAKDIQDPGTTQLTVRYIYKTRDGERKFSQVFNIAVLP